MFDPLHVHFLSFGLMFLFTLVLNKRMYTAFFLSLTCVFHICDSEPLNSANQEEKQFRLFSMVLNALEAVVIVFFYFL